MSSSSGYCSTYKFFIRVLHANVCTFLCITGVQSPSGLLGRMGFLIPYHNIPSIPIPYIHNVHTYHNSIMSIRPYQYHKSIMSDSPPNSQLGFDRQRTLSPYLGAVTDTTEPRNFPGSPHNPSPRGLSRTVTAYRWRYVEVIVARRLCRFWFARIRALPRDGLPPRYTYNPSPQACA